MLVKLALVALIIVSVAFANVDFEIVGGSYVVSNRPIANSAFTCPSQLDFVLRARSHSGNPTGNRFKTAYSAQLSSSHGTFANGDVARCACFTSCTADSDCKGVYFFKARASLQFYCILLGSEIQDGVGGYYFFKSTKDSESWSYTVAPPFYGIAGDGTLTSISTTEGVVVATNYVTIGGQGQTFPSGISFQSNSVLKSAYFPNLASTGGSFIFTSNPQLTFLSFPVLTSAGTISFTINIKLTYISLPSITTITGNINVYANTVSVTVIPPNFYLLCQHGTKYCYKTTVLTDCAPKLNCPN